MAHLANAGSSSDEESASVFVAPATEERRRQRRRIAGVAVAGAAVASASWAMLAWPSATGRAPHSFAPALGAEVLAAKAHAHAHAHAAAPDPTLTYGRANCNVTHKCATPGMLCYEQNAMYAQCRSSCMPGVPDPTHWDGQKWSCKELGERTPGEDPCVDQGQDCRTSKCCRQPGYTCFEKSKEWATCKASCQPGPSFADIDGKPWTCKKLGETKESTQPWVSGDACSAGGGSNCIATGCCKNAGEICYKNNDYYGECKVSCSEGGWNCGTVGMRTPAQAGAAEIMPIPDWGWKQCSNPDAGCKESGCCLGMDQQCYEKDETWAQCKSWCTPGPHADDKNASWTCNAIGPRSYGKSTKGFPSLYCFSVIRTQGYELGLMQAQHEKGAGIFACDDYSLLSADGVATIGDVKSIQFPGAPITKSVDNTAGNTELFVHAWQALVWANIWRDHTFTVKVDPDAVMIADRLRNHVRPYVGQKMFIINCPLGDMIFGALEVFSYHAILEWSWRHGDCPAPNNWGEDKYMTHCMDVLGAQRIHDIPILADNLCLGADCGNGVAAAFHPYKDIGSWMNCWNRAAPQQAPVTIRK